MNTLPNRPQSRHFGQIISARLVVGVVAVSCLACFGGPSIEQTSVHPADFPVGPITQGKQVGIIPVDTFGLKSTTIIYDGLSKRRCLAAHREGVRAGFDFRKPPLGLAPDNGEVGSKDEQTLSYLFSDEEQCLVTWTH